MISIIVPAYNVEKYISKCIESILNQTYEDFEVLLINDGSTDNTLNICNEYAKKDSRIRVINKENGGLSSARNKGIDFAKGDWISFIDSDDYIHQCMYEILYRNIIFYDADISMCNYKKVYNENINLENVDYKYSEDIKIFNKIEALNQLYIEDNTNFVIMCNKLYKKELFRNLRFDIGQIHEDQLIIHKILFKCNKLIYNNIPLYYYLQREGSIMNQEFNIKKISILRAFEDRILLFYKNNMDDLQHKAEKDYLLRFFTMYFKIEDTFSNCTNELKELRIQFIKIMRILIKGQYNYKEKVSWLIFCISPHLYRKRFICRKR